MTRTHYLKRSMLAAPMIGHLGAYGHANVLTGLIPSLYAGLDIVSRELVGMIPAVSRNASVERAAVGQSVLVPIVPTANVSDIVPAMAVPEPTDQTIDNVSIMITKSRAAEFGWTGEEQRGLDTGPGYSLIVANQFAQGLRALTNEVERDLCVEAVLNASRATGAVGTSPFASDIGPSAQLRKILDDNGAPATGRSLIINTTVGSNMRTLKNLATVNESGTTMGLRDGELLNLNGLSVKESGQMVEHTAGTAASATTGTAGYPIGTKVIPLSAAGTGTFLPGDVVKFAGDANAYVLVLGDTDVSNGGSITIAEPGLRRAIPAAATAITLTASFAASVAFSQNAMQLAARQPTVPKEGDAAIDRTTLVDVRSGLAFEVAIYAVYRKIRAEVGLAWGVKNIKRSHTALLIG